MKTKLTLSVSSEAVLHARKLARSRGTSVSSLFEKWAVRVAQKTNAPSLAESLRGRWQKEEDPGEDARLDYLLGKHVRK